MKKTILLPLITLILAVTLLFGLSIGLNGIASKNAQKAHHELLCTLLPGSTQFTLETYTGTDENIRSIHRGEGGYVIETATAGYAQQITLLVGVSNKGSVTGLVILQQGETWSLGASALTDWKFLSQFLQTGGDASVGENVDALTGATVTSKAIARCVNSAVAFVTGADIDSGATSWGG